MNSIELDYLGNITSLAEMKAWVDSQIADGKTHIDIEFDYEMEGVDKIKLYSFKDVDT